MRNPNQEIEYAIGVVEDITERKKGEAALREEKEKSQMYLNIAGVMFIAIDAEEKIILANHRASVILGDPLEKITGGNWFDNYIPEQNREEVRKVFRQLMRGEIEPVEYYENPIINSRGNERMIGWHNTVLRTDAGKIYGILGSGKDITEKRQAEEKLKQYSEDLEQMVIERTKELEDAQAKLIRKERLAVLGQIAGSIGHDLRNPLGSIKNAAYYLDMKLEDSEENVRKMIKVLARSIDNADNIINSLLGFARPKPPAKQNVNINVLINETCDRNTLKDNVILEKDLSSDLPSVSVDPDNLIIAFNNIILNADQAMPEGGKLIIKTGVNENVIFMKISDTGVGMTNDVKEKMFEPLFTNKAKGIGLGMAIAKMALDANDCNITVESESGRGTEVIVAFPPAAGSVKDPKGRYET